MTRHIFGEGGVQKPAHISYLLSLGDSGLQIESSTIRIPSCLNSNVDFGPIKIWPQKSDSDWKDHVNFWLILIFFDQF